MPQLIATAVASYVIGTAIRDFTAKKNTNAGGAGTVPPAIQTPNPLDVRPAIGGAQIGIFGSRRVGGRVIFSYRNGTKTYFVMAIAGAPVSKVVGAYVNNTLVATNASGQVTSSPWVASYGGANYYSMQLKIYDGTQTVADPWLRAAVPNYPAAAVGTLQTYAVVIVDTNAWTSANVGGGRSSADVYASGLPDITFWVLGFPCYDPRDVTQSLAAPATWKWSSNPSVIEANYRIHELGAKVPTSMIDWASVATCAAADDALVSTKSGAQEYRYQCALYWTTDERHEAVQARIAASHDGGMQLSGGKWRCRTGVWTAPPVSITVDDYLGAGLTITDVVPISSTANGVRGKFSSAAANFEARDFPTYQDAPALAQDGTPIWLDLDLSPVVSASQAQRLARIAYNRQRFGRGATLHLHPRWMVLEPDDTFSLTDAYAGIAGETFRVLACRMTHDFVIEVDAISEGVSTYAWNAATDETAITAYLPVGGLAGDLAAPGLGVYDANINAGSVAPVCVLSPSMSQDWDQYQIIWTNGNTQNLTRFVTGGFTLTNGTNQTGTLTMQARVVNSVSGRASQYVSITFDANGIDNQTLATTMGAGSGRYKLPSPIEPVLVASAAGKASLQVQRVTGDVVASGGIFVGVTNPGDRAPGVGAIALITGTTPDFAAAYAAAKAGGTNVQFVSNDTQTIELTKPAGTVLYCWLMSSPTAAVSSWDVVGAAGVSPQSPPTRGTALVF